MICTYMRSSSYNNYDFCQQQYFLTYVLGFERIGSKKMDKGTIVHKILECLAFIKLQAQSTNHMNWILEDDCLTKPIDIYRPEITEITQLNNQQIDEINKSRVNKSNYPENCNLSYGHQRRGINLVETIIDEVYNYYVKNTKHKWQPVDFRDVTNWTWMALDYKDGIFDPRLRHIIEPEIEFDLTIKKPWAEYEFEVNGKKFKGNLAVRGTIDLLTRVDDGIIEIVDWKSGQRLNWATGKRKDYKSLSQDPQLLMYYWAARQLFPNEQVIVSIFWIRDGGPYTFCFDDKEFEKAETLMAKRFKEIQDCKLPQMIDPLQNSFKCNRICDYYKNTSPNGKDNMCRFIHNSIKEVGIDVVTEQYNNGTFDTYQSPGEI